MSKATTVIAFVLMILLPSWGAQSPAANRDKALEEAQKCLQREARGKGCSSQKGNIQTLIAVYRSGDRSVLPTLLEFTYLQDFYDEAMVADPDSFLKEMSQLPGEKQRAVAAGISGWLSKIRSKEHFEKLRTILQAVPDSSSSYQTAQLCLRTLEKANAFYLVNYFPPQTFNGAAADARTAWFSGEMYALGEKPLSPQDGIVYRFTYIPSFNGSAVIALRVQPDGTGLITAKGLRADRETLEFDENVSIPAERVKKFFAELNQARFWAMQTEKPSSGFDGAEWIFEGVQDGKYHMVDRWCPGEYGHSPDDAAFAHAARMLFEMAGHKHNGSC